MRTGRYSKSPSIICLNPLILLKLLLPKTKSLATWPLFLLSLISRRHCFQSVPFRCSRPSSCLSGCFINTRRCDPTLRDMWDLSRTPQKRTKTRLKPQKQTSPCHLSHGGRMLMLSCLGSVVSAAVKGVCFDGNRIPE